ncbi:transglycosylase SLT domain-containing protein [Stutzerimonas nitrititolerans]|uniref:transglycosylase SLT domain-containing protein n=1 Tax=Stutzerimonas nitrititolerans TaxID=2482751 RepID=UPI0028A2143D|nr:transglycosylase SLT domain-containing protein [Stutzerimonas nitrititolerans]
MNNGSQQYDKIKAEGGPFDSLIKEASDTHGVSYALLHKQLFVESSFNPQAVSPTGPRGLGQFTKATGRAYGLVTDEDFFDPAKSIDAAARHMKDNLKIADGDELRALLAYNQGAGKLGRPQLEAYDRGDLSGVSEEGRNYMAKMMDVANTGKKAELDSFLVKPSVSGLTSGGITEAPAGIETKPSAEPGSIPFNGASMYVEGEQIAEKAPTFAQELYETKGQTEDRVVTGFFKGTKDAVKASIATSPLGVAIRAASMNDEADFSEAFAMLMDTRNDPLQGDRLSDWTDEDYDKLKASGLDPQFYDVVLRGYKANFESNLKLALENENLIKELARTGLGSQVVGSLGGSIGDPWTFVNPARGVGAALGARVVGGSVANGVLGGISEHDTAKVSGREADYTMAIAGGAAFGGVLNGLLGARPGRNSWDIPGGTDDLMGPDDFKGLIQNNSPDPMEGQLIRLENREKARLSGANEDPTRMPYRADEDVIHEDGAVPYMDAPFDKGAARLTDGTIVSGGSPLNPKTLKDFREVTAPPVKANAGVRLGSISEIGLTLGRSEDEAIRGIAADLFRSPTAYQDGSNGKFGATASDIVERLRSQDNITHNRFASLFDEALKEPLWHNQWMTKEAKLDAMSRRVVEAIEASSYGGKGPRLTGTEQKLMQELKDHMTKKWDYIENPGQFGNVNARSLLEETRHAGSYFPMRYSTHAKQMMIQKLGGADELQEAIMRSWLASYAKRPATKARVDKLVEESLKKQGITEKATPEQIKQAVEEYARKKSYGISHTDQFNRGSLVEEHLKDGAGVENNDYLEARNLFDSDVRINLPDGTLFNVDDLREFNVLRLVPQYDRRVNGDIALMGGTGKSTAELKAMAVKLGERAARGQGTADADALLDALKLFTGRSRRNDIEGGWETMVRSLMDTGFVAKNAFMGIQNFTEAASLAVKGHLKMLTHGVPYLKHITTAGTKLSADDVRILHGTVFGKELDDLIRPTRQDIVDRLRESGKFGQGKLTSQAFGSIKWATGEAAVRSPFTWVLRESGNLIIDAGRQGVLVDLADSVLNGSKSKLFTPERLRSASISPEQMAGIEDLIKAHFKRTEAGKWSLTDAEQLAADPRAMDLWRLGDAVADETILRPHKMSIQASQQMSAYWSAALQFKMFVLRSINSRGVRGWYEATRNGQALDQTLKVIVSTGMAVGFYAAQARLKALALPEREREAYLNRALSNETLTYAAISRGSHLGAIPSTLGFIAAPFGYDPAAMVRTSILPRGPKENPAEDRPIRYGVMQSPKVQDFLSRSLEQVPAAGVLANGFQGIDSAIGLAADQRGADLQGYRTGLWNSLKHFVPNDPVSQNLMRRMAEVHGVDRSR